MVKKFFLVTIISIIFGIASSMKDGPKREENLNSLNYKSIESNRDVSNDSKILSREATLNKLRKKRKTNRTSIKPNYCSKVYCKVTSCNYFKGILYQLCKKCVYNDKYCISEGSDVF